MTIPQAYELAVQHHQAGRLAEAEAIYRQILAVQPQHGEALHLLGLVTLQAGRVAAAVELLAQARALIPAEPAVHSNLGAAYRAAGRGEEAIAAWRRALELQPDLAATQQNLGGALLETGRVEEARECFLRVLAFEPDNAAAHRELGLIAVGRGQLDEASAAFLRVRELHPDDAAAHLDLGRVWLGAGRLDDAVAAFRRVVELRPEDPAAHGHLGNAFYARGELDAAIACYRRTLALQPDSEEAHHNLGNAFKDQGRVEEAFVEYRRALQLRPESIEIHDGLLFSLHYAPDLEAAEIFREHLRWDERHARPLMSALVPHANDRNPERRLRIGYVSPDFRTHSVAFFLENFLPRHDDRVVEVFCYADLLSGDAVTARLRAAAGHWREIFGMAPAQIAALIRRDEIDLLVDLAGHTALNGLLVFAHRPAPVQVTYLGYCDTTGMQAMDYRLTDIHADPPGTSEHLHTEELVRLPETFAVFQPAEEAPPVGPLPALARGSVTFASLHTLAKINEPLLECWAEILHRVPGARLLMRATALGDASCRARLTAFFAKQGIAPERLEFQGRATFPEYLALHGEVDVLLDAHPFSGHTVSCHALWMGVPVVTLAGDRHCARMVASVLQNVGLPELIAHSPAEYVEIAAALAADLPRLAELRAGLRARMAASPLLDGPRFARNVEAAYREMWRTWCAKQPEDATR